MIDLKQSQARFPTLNMPHVPANTNASIRIGIVDDHQLMRSGLRKVLESLPDVSVVGEAANATQAYDLVRSQSPDVLLLDWSMPGETGLNVTQRLTREGSATRVIMVSMFDSAGFARQAKIAGARGYVIKGSSPDELADAIRQVAGGASFVYVAEPTSTPPNSSPANSVGLELLTSRQIDVLRLLAIGRTNKEIADALFISCKTVEHHRTNIKKILGINESARLVLYAVKHGIVSPAELEDNG
jgi:DNA-binding NarL/FixJ family response regulator